MNSIKAGLLFLGIFLVCSCNKEDETIVDNSSTELYFPPIDGSSWETIALASLSWDSDALEGLRTFLEDSNTRAFIVLQDGKIVIEEYWGRNITNTAPFDKNTNWYWASAGKTITAALVGIAQEEGLLDIENPTSDYLGTGWTSMTTNQETQVKVKHQLMMTTGLDYTQGFDCIDPACLQYREAPGDQWYYHNGPYTLLKDVVESATRMNYSNYTNSRIADKIGMSGFWLSTDDLNVYWSKPRDMARFGLMMLNEGMWDNRPVMTDMDYFNQMISTSQDINPSYGYLWWLNGKDSHILPALPTSFNSSFSPNAPDDLIIAAGKNAQFLSISPSRKLVVIRMGDAPDDSLVPNQYHDEMWDKINAVIED